MRHRTQSHLVNRRSAGLSIRGVAAMLAIGSVLVGCASSSRSPQCLDTSAGLDTDKPRLDLGPLRRVSADASTSPIAIRADRPSVVLFWSAWCAPSRESLVELTRQANQDHTRAWDFLAVTFHSPEDTAADMRALGIDDATRLAMCVDEHGQAFRAIRAVGTPIAAVVDAQGVLIGVFHPSDLTPETLAELLAGRDPGIGPSDAVGEHVPEFAWDIRTIADTPDARPGVRISPVEARGSFARFDRQTGFISIPGDTAGRVLARALGVRSWRLEWDGVDIEERDRLISVRAVPPDRSLETARRTLADAVCRGNGWALERTTRVREALVITTESERRPTASDADVSSARWMGPSFQGDATVGELAGWIESITATPSVDATGLGDQLFTLSVTIQGLADLRTALAEMGLTLSKRPHEIEVIRVFPAR